MFETYHRDTGPGSPPPNPQQQRVGVGPSSALPMVQPGHSGPGHIPPWAHKASYELQTCPHSVRGQSDHPPCPPCPHSVRGVRVTILTALTTFDPSSGLFSQNNAYLELSQTYFYNLFQ